LIAAVLIGAAVAALVAGHVVRQRNERRRAGYRRNAQKRARVRRDQYFLL
jgi:stalled ribosome alternative rescue factor ArfA